MSQTTTPQQKVSFDESEKPPSTTDVSKKDSSQQPGSDADIAKKSPSRKDSGLSGAEAAQRTRSPSVGDQAREFLTWTMNDVFDWNPRYAQQLRGVLNIVHVVLSMLTFAIVGSACQMEPYNESGSYGFYCKSSDTFLFVVASSAFISSFLFLLCCLLSKKSESRLFSTSFEVTYYIVYFTLLFISSVALIGSVVSRNTDRSQKEEHYNSTLAGAAFGIITCAFYGASIAWFFVYHRIYEETSSEENDYT